MPISTIGQNGLNAPLSLTTPALGTPSALVLTNATGLGVSAMPTGSVIQVVSATFSASVSTTTTSFVTSASLAVTITPQFTASKIFIYVSGGGIYLGVANSAGRATIVRGSTDLSGGNGIVYAVMTSATAPIVPVSMGWLDSPATTSATTYYVGIKSDNSGNQAGFNNANANVTFMAMEIR